MNLLSGDPTLYPYLALILFGFLPSEIWRVLGVVISHGIDEDSELFRFVRSVATVLLVGVVAKIVFLPSRELAAAPVWARGAAFAVAAAGFFAARRSVFAAIVAGEATIILVVWWWAR
ncbi:MAG TPA: AzlD domain-containing protein [Rhodoblastus sp.]|nr:AzlD domain-containing protein [Rhodoblastus sp.]